MATLCVAVKLYVKQVTVLGQFLSKFERLMRPIPPALQHSALCTYMQQAVWAVTVVSSYGNLLRYCVIKYGKLFNCIQNGWLYIR